MSTHNSQLREYLRARALARTLHARVYVTSKGHVHRTSGLPKFGSFLRTLQRCPEGALNPWKLGFPVASEGVFSPDIVRRCFCALGSWETYLAGAAPAMDDRRIGKERSELQYLRGRWAAVQRWVRSGRLADDQVGSVLLDDRQERELGRILALYSLGEQTPSAARLARLVYWVRGRVATTRYLDTLTATLARELPIPGRATALLDKVETWETRARHEPADKLGEQMRHIIDGFSANFGHESGITGDAQGKSPTEHCAELRRRCHDWIKAASRRVRSEVERAFAALVCCDAKHSSLPRRIADRYLDNGHDAMQFCHEITMLGFQLNEPAYPRLASALNSTLADIEPQYFYPVRRLIARGTAVEDIQWLHRQDLLKHFRDAVVTPAWTRRLEEMLVALGSSVTLSSVMSYVETARDAKLIELYGKWFRSLQTSGLTQRLTSAIEKAFTSVWLPAMSRLQYRDELERWLRLPRKLTKCGDLPDAEAQAWMNKIAHYQRIAGQTPSIPKSLRKQLDYGLRCRSEMTHLQQVERQAATLSDQQRARLKSLRKRLNEPPTISSKRLVRAAREVYVTTALDALRHVIRGRACDTCRRLVGLEDVPPEWLFDLTSWLTQLSPHEREIAREIVATWREHRRLYRAHLARNQPWLVKARRRGLRVEEWLAPSGSRISVAGEPCRLEVSHRPADTFLMGSYVSTCLSLPDGCNADSVRANAYDANKQVLYIRNRAGHIVARQLVAVTSEFRLVRYGLYTTFSDEDHQLWEDAERSLAKYCGRWARRVGLPLADEGEPETILDEEWYDDDTCPWDLAAQAAWNEYALLPGDPARDSVPSGLDSANLAKPVLAGVPLA